MTTTLLSSLSVEQKLAHITPHAWAVDAFTEVVQRGGGLGDIGTELGVLVAYGIAVLVGGAFVLRRSIVA